MKKENVSGILLFENMWNGNNKGCSKMSDFGTISWTNGVSKNFSFRKHFPFQSKEAT